MKTASTTALIFFCALFVLLGYGFGAMSGQLAWGEVDRAMDAQNEVEYIADEVQAFFDAAGRGRGAPGGEAAADAGAEEVEGGGGRGGDEAWYVEIAERLDVPRGNGARWFWAFEEAGEDSFEHGKPRLTITRDEAGEVTSVEVRALGENGQRDAGRDDLMADLITGERIGVDDWVPWPALNAYVALLGLVLLAVFSAPALAAAWRDEENGVPGLVLCLGGVGGCGIGTWQHAVPLDTWDYVWPVIATAGPMIWLAVLATPSKKPDQSPAAREDRTPEPDQRD